MVLPKMRLQTCEPVSTERSVSPVRVFLNLMLRSAVPPPEASRPCWCGDQATALTAAMWSEKVRTGLGDLPFQIISLLSFPPEQSCCSSGDHFSPQISCLWPTSLLMSELLARMSLLRMVLSLEPVLMTEEFQAMLPTRFEWPCSTLILLTLLMSQMCTSPLLVPSENVGPLTAQPTEVTVSDNPRSHNFVTLELSPFHRQTLEASPTARKFCCDQSMRFRQKSSWSAGASSTLNGNLLIFLLLLMEVTSSQVKSKPLRLSSKGWRWLSCWPYLRRLLFWKYSMGLSNFMLFLGSFMMQFLQMSASDSVQGSTGAGAAFQLLTLFSYYLTINQVFRFFLVGMKRSVTIAFSPRKSPFSPSRQESKASTLISRSLVRVRSLLTDLDDEGWLDLRSGDSGLWEACCGEYEWSELSGDGWWKQVVMVLAECQRFLIEIIIWYCQIRFIKESQQNQNKAFREEKEGSKNKENRE